MFSKTFAEAVTRWRREQRPRAGESWYAVHYRSGWLIEKMNFRDSVELLRQGLDVRPIDPKDRGRRKRKRMLADLDRRPTEEVSAGQAPLPRGSGDSAPPAPDGPSLLSARPDPGEAER